MTQAREPGDRDREINREIRVLNRRVDRLEYSQISPQEFQQAFDRVYEEIDDLTVEVRGIKTDIGELNRKFDIIMNHITGQANSNP
jgi:septation ring formation regulator EzrA